MNCIYKTLDVKTISEMNTSDYFILLEEKDILRKTNNEYELTLIDYSKRAIYQKISDTEIKEFDGNIVESDPDRLVQRVKILKI